MPEITVELSVGDVLVIGDRTVTVIDIEGSEVHFRLDDGPGEPIHSPDGPVLISSPEPKTFRLKAR